MIHGDFKVDARHHSRKLLPASQSLEENAKLKKKIDTVNTDRRNFCPAVLNLAHFVCGGAVLPHKSGKTCADKGDPKPDLQRLLVSHENFQDCV